MSERLPSGAPALARILSGALGSRYARIGHRLRLDRLRTGERHFTGSGAFLGPLVGA